MTFRHYHRKWRIWRNKFGISKLVKKITPLMLAVLMSKNVDGQGLPLFKHWDTGSGYFSSFYNQFLVNSSTKFFDIDNDGDFDIISPNIYYDYFTSSTYSSTFFFENKGNPDFANFNLNEFDSTRLLEVSNLTKILGIKTGTMHNYQQQFIDIDKDNDDDLVVLGKSFSKDSLEINIHLNNKIGKQNIFSEDPLRVILPPIENSYFKIQQIYFVDDDESFDLILTNGYQDSTFFLLNDGNVNNPLFDINKRQFIDKGNRFHFVDFDSDGISDIGEVKEVDGQYNDHYTNFYIIFKKGISGALMGFEEPENVFINPIVLNPMQEHFFWEVMVEDIDMDGDIDIFGSSGSASRYGSIYWTGMLLENVGKSSNNINGLVFIDLNGDGDFSDEENFNTKETTLLDSYGEPYIQTIKFHKISNHPIVVENLDYIFPIDENGYFQLYTSEGTQKIYPKSVPNFEFEPPFYTYDFPVDTNITVSNVQFVMKPITGRYDIEVDISGLATRPGFETKQYLHYKNLAGNPTNGTLSFTPPAELTVLSAQPNYDRVESGVYYWDIEDLQGLESEQVEVNLQVDVNAVLNTPIQSVVGFELTNGTDFNPLNNTDTLFGRITGSFDPNDKLVTPTGLDGGLTAVTDQPFEYTIRFQNMGNDTAFTVIITDTLDTDFNLSSFEMVGSSHNYELSVRDNNVLIWKFRNILLPPSSTNLTGSQGFVKYRFTPKEGADIGTIFTNKADIYFDYNTPVVTNETRNIFGVISGIHNHQHQQDIVSKAYPNPTKNKLLIEFNNAEKQDVVITIYDIEGQQILQKTIREGFFSFDVHNLSAGTYLYTIESVSAFGKGKFIKE